MERLARGGGMSDQEIRAAQKRVDAARAIFENDRSTLLLLVREEATLAALVVADRPSRRVQDTPA